MEGVSWNDAIKYCALLTEREMGAGRLPKGYVYRLPTEAEWEYACRAGTSTRFYYGDDVTDLVNYAWYGMNSDFESHEVGEKLPNLWGLYDMYGNVWEWCQDVYEEYPMGPVIDPIGPEMGLARVLRGGGWTGGYVHCRSASRDWSVPKNIFTYFGFRVVLGHPYPLE